MQARESDSKYFTCREEEESLSGSIDKIIEEVKAAAPNFRESDEIEEDEVSNLR